MARVTKIYDSSGQEIGRTVKQHGCLSFIGWCIAISLAVGAAVWLFQLAMHAIT